LLCSGSLLDAAFVMWWKIVVNIKYTEFKGYVNADFSLTVLIWYYPTRIVDVYIRQVAIHEHYQQPVWDRSHHWYLIVFLSDSFSCSCIFHSCIFHSCIFHSRIFSAPPLSTRCITLFVKRSLHGAVCASRTAADKWLREWARLYGSSSAAI